MTDSYPFMRKPDWKQYHALEAAEALERLPVRDRDRAAALVDQPATPPSTAIKMLKHLGDMKARERAEVFALNESPDVRDRSLAATLAVQLPPMPDPRLTRIDDAIRSIQAAVAPFPNDPEAQELREFVAGLRSLSSRIGATHKERCRAGLIQAIQAAPSSSSIDTADRPD